MCSRRTSASILLSFAQFERGLTSERIKDKFAALRAQGLRPQGMRPFGYQLDGRRLVVDQAEAAVVTRIYALFIDRESPVAIATTLNRAGRLNHRKQPFSQQFVRRILRNRLYLGDLVYGGQSTPRAHPAIISERVWTQAQALIGPRSAAWDLRVRHPPGMLADLLFGPSSPLLQETGCSKGKTYRYYGPSRQVRRGLPKCENGRYRAAALEQHILNVVDPDGHLACDATVEAAAQLLRSLVDRIDIRDDIAIRLMSGHTIIASKPLFLSSSRLRRQILVLPRNSDHRRH